ncbi:hypothetical protein VTK26DRAFT_6697 [Humicola hyalothermophila]
MPIINGQKMACAPCIRGHRSTKCNHFYERVMVPVRKPGRPLSTCPCPPGRPCACGGVRIAIPKKKRCKCPTESANEADGPDKEQAPAETPTSPSRPSFRVTKSNGSSKANNRKQSFDPSTLERMDPQSINLLVAPSSNGATNGRPSTGKTSSQRQQGESAGLGTGVGLVTAGSVPVNGYAASHPAAYGAPVPYNMGHQYAQQNQLQHGIKGEDGGFASPFNGNFAATMPPPPFTNGNHPSPPLSSLPQPIVLGSPPLPKAASMTSGGNSCCGGNKAKGPSSGMGNIPLPQQGYGQPCVSRFPPSADIRTQVHSFQYPSVFTYPAQYGSWQQPIDPIIWQQVASQNSMPLNTPIAPPANDDLANLGPSHQCSCGEGCQCVGCLAHPFNSGMFQYVNDAYSDSNGGSPAATTMGPSGNGASTDAGTAAATTGSPAQSVGVPAGQESPQLSEGSPAGEEQSLSTMDYFFVNLPISGLCGGSLETCPCGDGCACPGCMVHHTPLQ